MADPKSWLFTTARYQAFNLLKQEAGRDNQNEIIRYVMEEKSRTPEEGAMQGKQLLLMFDELFKGTNVKDAYDGTLAVTEGFAEYEDCLFIVSTHIIEVGEALRERSSIIFGYMPTVLQDGRPRYTYQMQAGITSDRQGMLIIQNEGILELLAD